MILCSMYLDAQVFELNTLNCALVFKLGARNLDAHALGLHTIQLNGHVLLFYFMYLEGYLSY